MKKIVFLVVAGLIVSSALLVVLLRSGDNSSGVVDTSVGSVLISGSNDGGADMGVEGTLAFTEAGCLAVKGPDESLRVLVLPAGTAVFEDPVEFEFAGQRLAVGDEFFGGGEDVEWNTELYPLPAGAPENCQEPRVVLLTSIRAD